VVVYWCRRKVDAGELKWQSEVVGEAKNKSRDQLEFPVMNEKTPYVPVAPMCPVCGLEPIHEPNSMAILNGGALLMSEDRQSGGMDDRLDGFLSFIWHGAHSGGLGQHRERFATVRVADNCRGGQYEMYFCSTECLRSFLNRCVDALEAARSEPPPARPA